MSYMGVTKLSEQGSITLWLHQLRDGDPSGADHLWSRFYHRLVARANRILSAKTKRVVDGEDVALSAFHSFFKRAEEGHFPKLNDREDLWRILITITERKALNLQRDLSTQKRGAGLVQGDSIFSAGDASTGGGFDQVAGREPAPEDIVLIAEMLEQLLGVLDEERREIAMLKLQSFTNEEIGKKLGWSVETIGRRLKIIRKQWEQQLEKYAS